MTPWEVQDVCISMNEGKLPRLKPYKEWGISLNGTNLIAVRDYAAVRQEILPEPYLRKAITVLSMQLYGNGGRCRQQKSTKVANRAGVMASSEPYQI